MLGAVTIEQVAVPIYIMFERSGIDENRNYKS